MKRFIYLLGIWSPWMVLLQVALKICDFQFESQDLYIMICTSKYMTLEESRQRVITSSVRSKANDTLKAFFLSKYISLCNSKNLRTYSWKHMILEQYSSNLRIKRECFNNTKIVRVSFTCIKNICLIIPFSWKKLYTTYK